MTQNEKDLLLKDLCARLPYGVKVQSYGYEDGVETIETLSAIDSDGYMSTLECETLKPIAKPYLFPLSSMTEEQKKEYNYQKHIIPVCRYAYGDVVEEDELIDSPASFEYLIENNFDCRGLIPMGLAIDATGLNIY